MSLKEIFTPKSIAIVGASNTKGKVGHDLFVNLEQGGYTGTIFPVNPKGDPILGHKCFKSVSEIEDPIDLALIIVAPKFALIAVEECVQKKVGGVIIISAGFKEVGGEGEEIENKIVAMCRAANIPVVGPNCLGVINPSEGVCMNASFAARMPLSGNVSFMSQSGALCTSVLDFATDRGFGFSKFISIGNKCDVDEMDLLTFLHEDPDTDVIMLYTEELKRGPEFIEAVRNITCGPNPKPVLAIKSGRTTAGAAAAASHTGSLAGSDAVYDAIFQQAGVIRVMTVDELFDYATAFAAKRYMKGRNVAIITNAGGPGILGTDMTCASGLELAKFPEELEAKLAKVLPATANIHNPVDVIGDAAADRYENSLEIVLENDQVDGALVILTPQSMTDALGTAKAVVDVFDKHDKPIVCAFMGVVDVSSGVKILQERGIPCYKFPENAAKSLRAVNMYAEWLDKQAVPEIKIKTDREKAAKIIADAMAAGKTSLGELDGAELIKCYDFPALPMALATSADEAAKIADEIGFPLVMKIVSPQIMHKSDAGGVKVGLKTVDEVRDAFDTIMTNAKNYKADAELQGVLVQKMAPKGEEVILGMMRYPTFGPLIMFGLGGVTVELFKDVNFRLAPLTSADAKNLIQGIQGVKLLEGFRGGPKADIAAIERMLISISEMVMNHPEIKELDINPLLVHPEGQGATVADILISLGTPE